MSDLDEEELFWTRVLNGVASKKEINQYLEELEKKYFLLQMQDNWNSEDYKYSNKLKEQIKRVRGEINERYK